MLVSKNKGFRIANLQVRVKIKEFQSLPGVIDSSLGQIDAVQPCPCLSKALMVRTEADANLKDVQVTRGVKGRKFYDIGLKLVPNTCLLGIGTFLDPDK